MWSRQIPHCVDSNPRQGGTPKQRGGRASSEHEMQISFRVGLSEQAGQSRTAKQRVGRAARRSRADAGRWRRAAARDAARRPVNSEVNGPDWWAEPPDGAEPTRGGGGAPRPRAGTEPGCGDARRPDGSTASEAMEHRIRKSKTHRRTPAPTPGEQHADAAKPQRTPKPKGRRVARP